MSSEDVTLHKSAVIAFLKQSAAMTEVIHDARKAIAPFGQGLSGKIVSLDYHPKDVAEVHALLKEAYCVMVEVQSALCPREVEV